MLCLRSSQSEAFAGLYREAMVVMLSEPERSPALVLAGAQLFEPMVGRRMKEWAQVPLSSAE